MRPIWFSLVLVVTCAFVSCQDPDTLYGEASDPVLTDSTWVEVITELYLAEALKNKRAIANKNISPEIRYLDSTIIADYGLTPPEFERAWYDLGKDLERFDKILDLVLERMTRLEEDLKTDTLRVYDFPKDLR